MRPSVFFEHMHSVYGEITDYFQKYDVEGGPGCPYETDLMKDHRENICSILKAIELNFRILAKNLYSPRGRVGKLEGLLALDTLSQSILARIAYNARM